MKRLVVSLALFIVATLVQEGLVLLRLHVMEKQIEAQTHVIQSLMQDIANLADASKSNSHSIVVLGESMDKLSHATTLNAQSIELVAKSKP